MDTALALETEQILQHKAVNEAIQKGGSDIQQFYSDATVFVTGGSGFLGKQLIEKLLRSCNINRIYLLMRPKKGKTVLERLESDLKDPVYDGLREMQPHFADKIFPVEGDVAEIQLGISDQDWSTLAQHVDVIFHVAATTRFDETLRVATLINIRGTREVISLAKSCMKLKSIVHVSTAFTHATQSRVNSEILEQFYPSPVPPETMIRLAESLHTDRLDAITASLIDDWPNTYAFTKAIAEEAVRTMAGNLPICIVRPPVVTCTYYEPTPGWLDMSSVYGPSGIILGVGLGTTHATLNGDVKVPMAPADYVNNAIISAGWDTAAKRGEDIKIYTVSSSRSAFSWSSASKFMRSDEVRKYATPKSVWYCYTVETANKFIYWLLTWLLHYIPAYLMDGAYFLLGLKKPEGITSFIKIYEKNYKISILYGYFLTNEWHVRDDNTEELFNRMSAQDKLIYNFDITSIDWYRLILVWCVGIRKYIIKDALKDTPYGIKKQQWFKIGNYIFFAVYLFVFWKVFGVFYSAVTWVF